jgi:hypothetical protein
VYHQVKELLWREKQNVNLMGGFGPFGRLTAFWQYNLTSSSDHYDCQVLYCPQIANYILRLKASSLQKGKL